MKILTAVICCNFKNYSLNECIDSIKKAGFDDVLINYETDSEAYPTELLSANHFQVWSINEWLEPNRQFDQDQGYRLPRIVTARNMCIDFAIKHNYDWLFFVDSDVLIPTNTMELLFENNDYKLKSGLVHGRGSHQGAEYVFNRLGTEGNWTKCEYSTCGFTAIHREIFRRVRFKWGEPFEGGALCSEDPLYGADVRHLYGINWMVNSKLQAQHIDNPSQPLTNDQASQY
jgi:hypothetical protein